MGEIGINRIEYLYELTYCDLLLIERGYERRFRNMWSAARWQTYYTMASFAGGKHLAESGIHGPKDLLKFPWDTEPAPPISDEEVAEMQREMEEMNKQLSQKEL